MHIPPRILRRAAAEADPTLLALTEREQRRQQRILTCATHLIARFGPQSISFTNLATAINIAPGTMRRLFCDMHALLGEIIRRHLQTLFATIEAVPQGAPNRAALQRQAYLDATRTAAGLTPGHRILTLYRNHLPDDERELADELRDRIGALLGGAHVEKTLALLDCPHFDQAQIERMLAVALQPEQTAAPTRQQPQALPPDQDHPDITNDLSSIGARKIPAVVTPTPWAKAAGPPTTDRHHSRAPPPPLAA